MNRLLTTFRHLPECAFQALLHPGDAAERAEVIAEVEHKRRSVIARGKGATKLLMEDDGRLRRADHHDCVDAADVDCLIELVDAIERLECVTVVVLEHLEVL